MILFLARLLIAAVLVLCSTSLARADMGEVTVNNWMRNDGPVIVVPGPFCSIGARKYLPVSVDAGATVTLDCDAVLLQDASPVTLFLVERAKNQTSLCSVRWDNNGIFTLEAGLVCRYGESSAADITVFTK